MKAVFRFSCGFRRRNNALPAFRDFNSALGNMGEMRSMENPE